MSQNATLLKATRVDLGYGTNIVLRNFSIEIRKGEFWCLLGKNGSGKSTLLKGLIGSLHPCAGHIERNLEFASRDVIGFVPQRCEANPALPTTVREFVGLGLVGLRKKNTDREQLLAWVLQQTDLLNLAHSNFWTLSDGQRQRALVARALIRQPQLLLVDEPTNNLDAPTIQSFLRYLEELNKTKGLAVVFVTHDLSLCSVYASHVALFFHGTAIAGMKDEILTSTNLELAFQSPAFQ